MALDFIMREKSRSQYSSQEINLSSDLTSRFGEKIELGRFSDYRKKMSYILFNMLKGGNFSIFPIYSLW